LAESGAAIEIGHPQLRDFGTRLGKALWHLQTPAALKAMSQSAAAITDGCGAARVSAALERPLFLRKATMDDAEAIWRWRDALPTSHFRAGSNASLKDHLVWFERALSDPRRRLLVAGTPAVAHLRLDIDETGKGAAVSVILAPGARGKGFGRRLLSRLADAARSEGIQTLTAEVHVENCASMVVFRAAGYTDTDPRDDFHSFSLGL
jgi:GNAT superfamily N-acetyltransferase